MLLVEQGSRFSGLVCAICHAPLRPGDLPRRMTGSVVPIVVGYAVAHYATLLIVEGQRVAINFSDPLGRGWNVFGSAEMGVNAGIFNHPGAIATIQLSSIVGGHLLGIVAWGCLFTRPVEPLLSKYERIRLGMSREELCSLLGAPSTYEPRIVFADEDQTYWAGCWQAILRGA